MTSRMLSPTEAIAQLAVYTHVEGIRSVHYPVQGRLPNPPANLFIWDGLTILGVEEQTWLIRVRMHMMVPQLGDTDKEIARTDPLVVRVIDALATTEGFRLEAPDGRGVDHCIFLDDPPAKMSAQLFYGSHAYFGHELFWQIKLRRFPGEGYEP